MSLDPEIKAMSECHQALIDLDDESKVRVIHWLIGKFDLTPISKPSFIKDTKVETINVLPEPDGDGVIHTQDKKENSIDEFDSVADIFTKTNPKTEPDKVLVVASYLQIKNNLQDLVSFDIQKELKHMGHGVANITSSISQLEKKKPKLMIQTRKEGKSQQAKKRYKVTLEGINSVKEMLKANT